MKGSFFHRVLDLYYDGFRSMTLGKRLWLIILIKLFVIFAILKLFFFPDFLQSNFSSTTERSDHVVNELTKRNHHD